jgi:hypothetical protein
VRSIKAPAGGAKPATNIATVNVMMAQKDTDLLMRPWPVACGWDDIRRASTTLVC